MRLLRAALAAAALAGLSAGLPAVAWGTLPTTAGLSAAVVTGPRATASTAANDWWFIPRGAHRRPGVPVSAARLLHRYGGIWIGGRHERVVYLTFDEADELGTTRRIIGILERAHVKASFFLTGRYIGANRAMTRRLAAHGHLLCNHSWSHPDMAAKARSRGAFTRELRTTERAFHAATGGRLARFFRPPFGTYSARSLQLAEQLGYATVFWSFAHYDYDEGVQPPVNVTLRRILTAAAPGVVYLLHASSRSNVNALAQAIHGLKAQHYRFATLDELR
jgi:peptidoglycan-N-acetylmuramic acid deacetylase